MENTTALALPLGLVSLHDSITSPMGKNQFRLTRKVARWLHSLITTTKDELFSKLLLVVLSPWSRLETAKKSKTNNS